MTDINIDDLTLDQKRALLARLLEKKTKKARESESGFPLSYGQRALWYLHKSVPGITAYNIMYAAYIRSGSDIPNLKRAFQALVDRHPSLRTTYTESSGKLIQQVHKHQEVCFETADASHWSRDLLYEQLAKESDRPFDLEQGPIMRVKVYSPSPEENILFINVHHIAVDFWSLEILLDELRILYNTIKSGSPVSLQPPVTKYRDFVRYQADMLVGPEGKRLWTYWQKQLGGGLPVLNLPFDRPRPKVQSFGGTSHQFNLDEDLSRKLKELAKVEGVTPYTTLLTAFFVLLYRYTGQKDLLVGSPTVGRSRPEFEKIVGYFVNSVVLRADFSGDPTFTELLTQVHHTVLDALHHQDYPFPLIVERLQTSRDPSRSPIFQVYFVWQKPRQLHNQGVQSGRGELELEPFAMKQRGAPFDLTFMVMEPGKLLSITILYNVDLFDDASIIQMAGHYQALLKTTAENPKQRVSELTPNVKAAQQVPPAPDMTKRQLDKPFVAPRNQTEQLLVRMCAQVLGIDKDKVSVYDSFFDLGGASIQSLEIITKANEAGLQLTLDLLFQYKTIAELAEMSDAAQGRGFDKGNTVIESLGVYLPSKVVSTKEILQGCKRKVLFPLEKMSGIKSRRMAGDGEFSIDLAKKAIKDCLAKSKYNPEDLDLLICCNISRCDGPGIRFSLEPSTSMKLKKYFGFSNAVVFDISNACTGMFTAINIVDAFIKVGAIRCGMVVSGEYITHLTQTGQKEIENFLDLRLACLTLGDAGAAVILEKSADDTVGFHEIEMFTLGGYSSYCIARATEKKHGGAIMFAESIKLTEVAVKNAAKHAMHILKESKWSPESFQHIIMHQTSTTSLRDAMREINSLFGKKICHEHNTIDNLAERGNTASTSHFVAVMDNIRNNRINPGDKIIFGISGSGQTLGTAFYTFDDLPNRLRGIESNKHNQTKIPPGKRPAPSLPPLTPRVQIESVGIPPGERITGRDSIEFLKRAVENCLKTSKYHRGDIDLLIHAGVYRKDFLFEPAIASIAAGQLDINPTMESPGAQKTFAFDVFNGSIGFLNACFVAVQMIRAKKYKTAMIVAAEIENNAEVFPEKLLGIRETGSALILEKAPDGKPGFGNIIFKYITDYMDSFRVDTAWKNGRAYLDINRAPDIYDCYIECIPGVVHDLLHIEGLNISQIKVIFPPQISSQFIARLSEKMNLARDKFVDTVGDGKDLFTSSIPYAFQYARENHLAAEGDVGLIISIGSGIQVGCAIYYF
ncbi:MAG: hypothetical protein JSV88_04455 [Candidatus Aminicenantes bacterium]|nr:MAG: hypothetical protein JSV88_04455 [Candidatus Aminicenantes bacterium]